MKKRFYVSYLLLLMFILGACTEEKTRVACVGNSITYGMNIQNRDSDSYPAVLQQLLDSTKYEVRNYGFSGRTLLNKGDYPYMKEDMYSEALDFQPNIVVIKLGTNDTKPQNWVYQEEYLQDMQAMIDAFRGLSSNPTIYLCYPAKAYSAGWEISDSIIANGVIPYINQIAEVNNLKIIDLYAATENMEDNFPDGIHPNEEGAKIIAETVYNALPAK
ncbi:Acetylxylan esterase [termite gut metagenome]|uniref:Acetylxylan esterase n=1 Tax=termite gut metagenome TaxID=433724 RepID=A0A5J4SI72_9ZZZZ